jgi:hypothetical protein
MQTRSDGGEADSEHIDVAVMPHGRPVPSTYVRMATVVACLRKASRNSSISVSGSVSVVGVEAAAGDGRSSLGVVAGSFVMERGR